jgi:hypothetical protein
MFMFFAIIFATFAMVCSFIVYSAITFRRFLAFVIGPPRWEAVDASAEMEELTQCFTGQRSIQIDEMRLGDSIDMQTPSADQEMSPMMIGKVALTPTSLAPRGEVIPIVRLTSPITSKGGAVS